MFSKRTIVAGLCGLLIGALTILGIRFVTYRQELVHYHANFAVYINGKQQAFNSLMYYLDGGCTMSNMMTPEGRAHLVKGIDGVVHVQDHAVTWGQFFENLGWYVGDDFIKTNDDFYTTTGDSTLHLIINGQDYTGLGSITNTVIRDKDRVLLSYGNESRATVDAQYKSVPNTAAKYDGMRSTSACGHMAKITTGYRLKHLF
jgi:hypothetical protein